MHNGRRTIFLLLFSLSDIEFWKKGEGKNEIM